MTFLENDFVRLDEEKTAKRFDRPSPGMWSALALFALIDRYAHGFFLVEFLLHGLTFFFVHVFVFKDGKGMGDIALDITMASLAA